MQTACEQYILCPSAGTVAYSGSAGMAGKGLGFALVEFRSDENMFPGGGLGDMAVVQQLVTKAVRWSVELITHRQI